MSHSGQYENNAVPYSPSMSSNYGGQAQQAQPPAGFTYESYQTPTAATKATTLGTDSHSASMATSPAATPQSREYFTDADVHMEDADPYNRTKYPSRLNSQNRPSSQYMPTEESSAARRYSPMNILSPTSPYATSPTKSQNPYAAPPSGASGSRQSPTRPNNYSSPPSKHLAKNPPQATLLY
jgi:dual specificity protein kinase YAK1